MSIRDAILATANPKPVAYEVTSWGTVYFRTLTVGEILAQQTDLQKGGGDEKTARLAMCKALCRVLVNPDNTPVFDPDNKDDLATVLTLPWQHVREAMEKSNKHNGLGTEAPKA
jgi:hypothetical protein